MRAVGRRWRVCALGALIGSALMGCTGAGRGGADEPKPRPDADGADGSGGGTSDGDELGPDADDAWPFSADAVLEIEVELDASDFDALRLQGRSIFEVLGGDCLDGPFESPYTEFPATVWVDGARHDGVGVRKKGFIGSVDVEKPGLRLDFDAFVDGGRVRGLENLTLNNTPQDPTMLRTCLAYQYFEAAGVPAPGCAFAHVVVNGEDLGLYAHVETVDEAMMQRLTGAAEVPLFEGTLSDLREGWTATFDLDSDSATLAQLGPAITALEAGDLATLGDLVDLDAYFRFAAAEAVLGHWDGYGWNRNNFYLFADPDDGRLRFLPWGADAVLSAAHPGGGRDWIATRGALGLAVAKDPAARAAYTAELERQLSTVWDPEAVTTQLAVWEELVADVHRSPTRARAELLDRVEAAAPTIRASVAAERGDYPDAPPEPPCISPIGSLDLVLDANWGSWTASSWSTPTACSMDLVYEGTPSSLRGGVGVAGDEGDQTANLGCYWWVDGAQVLSYFGLPLRSFGPGSHLTNNTVNYGILYYAPPGGGWGSAGWLEGELVLDVASSSRGAPVQGRFVGTLWQAPW